MCVYAAIFIFLFINYIWVYFLISLYFKVGGVEHLVVLLPADMLKAAIDSIAERWPAEVSNIELDDLDGDDDDDDDNDD